MGARCHGLALVYPLPGARHDGRTQVGKGGPLMDSLIGAVFLIACLSPVLGVFLAGTCHKMKNLP